jgi:integrase
VTAGSVAAVVTSPPYNVGLDYDAGCDARDNGTHALRHFYASALLDGGENIRAVSEYLGHADPGFTLRVYTHLMPSSAERTRRAIDAVFGPEESAGHVTDMSQEGA